MSSYIPRVYKNFSNEKSSNFHYKKQEKKTPIVACDCPHCKTNIHIGNIDIRECKEEFIRALCKHKTCDIDLR